MKFLKLHVIRLLDSGPSVSSLLLYSHGGSIVTVPVSAEESQVLGLVLLEASADTAGVVGEVESDRHTLLSVTEHGVSLSQCQEHKPVYHQGEGLDVEVLLQFPLGVLQHLHRGLGLRKFGVQLRQMNL